MKNIIWSLLLLLPYTGFGQDFIDNPHYIYGVGYGATIEEADSRALESFVTNLRVDVSVYTSLNVIDDNGTVHRQMNNNVRSESSLSLRGVYRHIDNFHTGEGYRVYRYLNSHLYQNQLLINADNYLEIAKKAYRSHSFYGTVSICLGYYYKAYECLTDPLLELLRADVSVKKSLIMDEMREIQRQLVVNYVSGEYFNYDYFNMKPTQQQYFDDRLHVRVYWNNSAMLNTDFEYWDGLKWSSEYNQDERKSVKEIRCTPSLPRHIDYLDYRIPFQVYDENGNKVNLNVPESFYSVKKIRAIPKHIIERWIADDKKDGYYH